MTRLLARIALGLVGVLLLAATGVVAYAQLNWDRTFEAPAPRIAAVTDSAVIERGRYLAYGPAHCAACHTPSSQSARIEAGEQLPLVGGHEWTFGLGTFRSRNLTPDVETGIGGRTDAELARMLRHGVRADGRAAVPFMEFQELSDEDLVAVISFLRSQAPVRNPVPDHELSLMGRVISSTMLEPVGPRNPAPARSPAEAPTVERGSYLVNNVANCAGCHTPRNMLDGSYAGPRLSGGTPQPLAGDETLLVTPPNLTPHARTGHVTNWTEEQFVARFRQGKLVEGSPMPWGPFGRMSDDDLRAIYRYLQSLDPVDHDTGPILRRKTDA